VWLDEFRYKWGLRKYLKTYAVTRVSHDSVEDFIRKEGEPDIRRAMEKEQTIQEHEIATFKTKFLVRQAYLHDVQLPDDEGWFNSRYTGQRVLFPETAADLRNKIRAVQKEEWDYWAGRVTFALAIIGAIFGVLAYFKK
jgi:hypothetical protein